MGFKDKIPGASRHKDETFKPNCQKDEDRNVWNCKPVLEKGDEQHTVNQPIQVVPRNGNFEPVNTGDASEEIIDRLDRHFNERKVNK